MFPDLTPYDDLPRFSDGRINFTRSDSAPVLNCFVLCKDELLLLKRSDKVGSAKNVWHVVAGYLDEPKSVEEKAIEELREETGVTEDSIQSVHVLPAVTRSDNTKKWFVHSVIVTLKEKPEIDLDFEHTEYCWVKKPELDQFGLLDGVQNFCESLF